MSNPLDMTQDDVERFNRWCAEHSVEIPGNKSTAGVDTNILVWDRDAPMVGCAMDIDYRLQRRGIGDSMPSPT